MPHITGGIEYVHNVLWSADAACQRQERGARPPVAAVTVGAKHAHMYE